MGRICIVHFQPLERYPPAVNLLELLGKSERIRDEVHVFTTGNNGGKKIKVPGVRIHRYGNQRKGRSKRSRIFFYIGFFCRTLLAFLVYRPHTVMYYETVSAGTPFFYKKFIRRSSKLFVHYHEYTSPAEYQEGMLLNRLLHRLEKIIYRHCYWISHTNEDRMKLFLKDIGADGHLKTAILPNHPPLSWSAVTKKNDTHTKPRIGFVYVGAISLEHLYVKEMAGWIAGIPDDCYWDIFSDNIAPGVLEYFEKINASNIKFRGSLDYYELPSILPNYAVGLILYKGHIPNYIFNVPNKFFEYHVCGVDVWFPQQMISCLPLQTTSTYPKVVSVDFENLDRLSLQEIMNKDHCVYKKTIYSCDETYKSLIDAIAGNDITSN